MLSRLKLIVIRVQELIIRVQELIIRVQELQEDLEHKEAYIEQLETDYKFLVQQFGHNVEKLEEITNGTN